MAQHRCSRLQSWFHFRPRHHCFGKLRTIRCCGIHHTHRQCQTTWQLYTEDSSIVIHSSDDHLRELILQLVSTSSINLPSQMGPVNPGSQFVQYPGPSNESTSHIPLFLQSLSPLHCGIATAMGMNILMVLITGTFATFASQKDRLARKWKNKRNIYFDSDFRSSQQCIRIRDRKTQGHMIHRSNTSHKKSNFCDSSQFLKQQNGWVPAKYLMVFIDRKQAGICTVGSSTIFLKSHANGSKAKTLFHKLSKPEMLGSIVLRLASPRKIWGEKKFGVKFFLSTQDGMKHPEMHKKVKVENFLWRWIFFQKMKVA